MQDPQMWPLIAVNAGLGVACAACLAVVAWAVARDLADRWRTRGRMPDAWPPGPADGEATPVSGTPDAPRAGEGGARC